MGCNKHTAQPKAAGASEGLVGKEYETRLGDWSIAKNAVGLSKMIRNGAGNAMQCQHINDERGRGVGIPTRIRPAIRRCQRRCILLLARNTCRGCRNAQSWHLHLQPRRRTSSDLQRHAPPRHRPLVLHSPLLVPSWFASCCRKLGRQGNHVGNHVLCCAVCPVWSSCSCRRPCTWPAHLFSLQLEGGSSSG